MTQQLHFQCCYSPVTMYERWTNCRGGGGGVRMRGYLLVLQSVHQVSESPLMLKVKLLLRLVYVPFHIRNDYNLISVCPSFERVSG